MQSRIKDAIQRFLGNCQPDKAVSISDVVAAVNWMLPGTNCDDAMVEEELHAMIVDHDYHPPVNLIVE